MKEINKKLIMLGLVGAITLGATGCTTLQRVGKSIESSSKGLHRKVTVYAMDGTIIKEYESKSMMVTDGDGGTIILDFEGKRIVLCNSQVVVEEIK